VSYDEDEDEVVVVASGNVLEEKPDNESDQSDRESDKNPFRSPQDDTITEERVDD